MLDLQRNLLTALLVAGIAALVAGGVAVAVFMGRPDVANIEARGSGSIIDEQVDAPAPGLDEFSSYAAILEQPVFFSDRKLPVVEALDEDDEDLLAEEDEEEDIQELAATVAGIIITPHMKLAMVADKQSNKTLVLREGMPLEGEQAAWQIETIGPRQVGFVSVDGRETELELAVNTSGLDAPTPPPQRTRRRRGEQDAPDSEAPAEAEQQAEEPEDGRQASEDARARAEEIRRRVAERRAQLREEAERRRRDGQ